MKAQAETMRGLKDATPEERKEKMKAGRAEMETENEDDSHPRTIYEVGDAPKRGRPRPARSPQGPGGPGAEKPEKN